MLSNAGNLSIIVAIYNIAQLWAFILPAGGKEMTETVLLRGTMRRRMRPAAAGLRAQRGFTLVEMLVVLAIIGMIVGLVGPRVLNYLNDAKIKTAKIQIENLASSLDLFYLDMGRYPTTEEGLAALVQRPGGAAEWSGPYIKANSAPMDPWVRPGKTGRSTSAPWGRKIGTAAWRSRAGAMRNIEGP
jgi:general secretion pathway protein G